MTRYTSVRNGLQVDFPADTVTGHRLCGAPICENFEAPPPLPLLLSGDAPGEGTAGDSYSYTPTTVGGTAPITYTLAEPPPSGWELDPATGTVFNPSPTAGEFTFDITATDSSDPQQTSTLQVTITIAAAPDP